YVMQATGVGKKTAERVVVDLSDKVGLPVIYKKEGGVQTELNTNDEALEALIALGFTLADATRALDGVDSKLSTSQRVREALRS
ncbi:MAG: Holliday junction branch migration protein RuvA, partial [Candidatus Saccharimonas sp.]